MKAPYVPLILTGLIMGIHSNIVTVRKVSVKAGHSISVPCLYEEPYIHNVKYLCRGPVWCTYAAVKTSQPDTSGKFAISDDTTQRIFTVTINDLRDDNIRYWCAVEKRYSDVTQRFQLSVLKGVPGVYVNQQEITASEGGSVTARCRYTYEKVTKWCRLGSSCVTVTDQSGAIDGTTVAIDASGPNVVNVTMSGLRTESSGWYFCDNEEFQMPVHIIVHGLSSTTTATTIPNTANFTGTLPTTTQNSSRVTSAEPHTARPTNCTIDGAAGESLQDEHKRSTMVTILSTTLVLLLLVVSAAVFGWRMMIKHNKNKCEGSDIAAGSQIGSDPDAHYATIVHNQRAAARMKQSDVPEDSVTYSTVVMKDSVQQTTEAAGGSVIYSTLRTETQ